MRQGVYYLAFGRISLSLGIPWALALSSVTDALRIHKVSFLPSLIFDASSAVFFLIGRKQMGGFHLCLCGVWLHTSSPPLKPEDVYTIPVTHERQCWQGVYIWVSTVLLCHSHRHYLPRARVDRSRQCAECLGEVQTQPAISSSLDQGACGWAQHRAKLMFPRCQKIPFSKKWGFTKFDLTISLR